MLPLYLNAGRSRRRIGFWIKAPFPLKTPGPFGWQAKAPANLNFPHSVFITSEGRRPMETPLRSQFGYPGPHDYS